MDLWVPGIQGRILLLRERVILEEDLLVADVKDLDFRY